MCENDYGNVKMGVLNIYELRNYSPLVQINIEIKHVTVTFSDLKVEINVNNYTLTAQNLRCILLKALLVVYAITFKVQSFRHCALISSV